MFYQRKRVVKEELTRALSQLFFQSRSVIFLYMYYGMWQKNRSDEPHESDERHVKVSKMTKFDKRQLPL